MKIYQLNNETKIKTVKKYNLAYGIFFLSGAVLFTIRILSEFNENSIALKFSILSVVFIIFYLGWNYWRKYFLNEINTTYEINQTHFIIKHGNGSINSYELKFIKNLVMNHGRISFEYNNKKINVSNSIERMEDMFNDLKFGST